MNPSLAGEIRRHQEQVAKAAAFLATRINPPRVALVLGTGLGGIAEQIENATIISYDKIPHFPQSTVPSHAGRLVAGNLKGHRVAALQGRFHYYEGYSTRELTFPLRVLSRLGAETVILSNAAGGLNPNFVPGTLMLIEDHLNFIPDNPLRGPNIEEWGPRFPDLSTTYDQQLIEKTRQNADRLQLPDVATGIYVAIPGPSLETPAETRFLRGCGADAVGMSTVPEVIVARHAGMRVLGISVISNVNDPDHFQPIFLEEVIETTRRAGMKFTALLLAVLEAL